MDINNLSYPHSQYHEDYIKLVRLLGKTDPVIVEIGSNNGGDAIRFLHYFPNCRLHCFEADERAIRVFKNNVKSEKCKLYEYIVSDSCGYCDFNEIHMTDVVQNIPNKHSWMSKKDYETYLGSANSSTSSLELRDNEFIKNVKIKSITLDKWIETESIESIDFLEIDVQGGESKVLDGAKEFLKIVRFIKIEYGESRYDNSITRTQTLNYLSNYDFEVIDNLSSKEKSGDLYFKKVNT